MTRPKELTGIVYPWDSGCSRCSSWPSLTSMSARLSFGVCRRKRVPQELLPAVDRLVLILGSSMAGHAETPPEFENARRKKTRAVAPSRMRTARGLGWERIGKSTNRFDPADVKKSSDLMRSAFRLRHPGSD